MGRYIGPVCKLCRREGEKLFLKGERCYTPKCSFEKRGFAPGMHGRGKQGRSERESDYARQLRAKQKARRVYGVFERQFRRYFSIAQHKTGLTGLTLLQTLELRLDNVVFRLGFASDRSQARQLVNHGHIVVNGVKSDIASMLLRPGDVVTVEENSRRNTYWKETVDVADKRVAPLWVERDVKGLYGRILRIPERAEIDGNLNEQLIVEYYSR
jgi:small subunit ribosomal protein S4